MAGVFAVNVVIESPAGALVTAADTGETRVFHGVANVGVRPTVSGETKPILEVHLFDFSGDVYGKRICVELLEKIRDEQKFDSFDALKDQIMRDCETARQLFSASGEIS